MSAPALVWQERRVPREWSASAGELVACVYPMRDAPVALSLDVKWQVFRREDGEVAGAVLLREGYAATIVAAQGMAAACITRLLERGPG